MSELQEAVWASFRLNHLMRQALDAWVRACLWAQKRRSETVLAAHFRARQLGCRLWSLWVFAVHAGREQAAKGAQAVCRFLDSIRMNVLCSWRQWVAMQRSFRDQELRAARQLLQFALQQRLMSWRAPCRRRLAYSASIEDLMKKRGWDIRVRTHPGLTTSQRFGERFLAFSEAACSNRVWIVWRKLCLERRARAAQLACIVEQVHAQANIETLRLCFQALISVCIVLSTCRSDAITCSRRTYLARLFTFWSAFFRSGCDAQTRLSEHRRRRDLDVSHAVLHCWVGYHLWRRSHRVLGEELEQRRRRRRVQAQLWRWVGATVTSGTLRRLYDQRNALSIRLSFISWCHLGQLVRKRQNFMHVAWFAAMSLALHSWRAVVCEARQCLSFSYAMFRAWHDAAHSCRQRKRSQAACRNLRFTRASRGSVWHWRLWSLSSRWWTSSQGGCASRQRLQTIAAGLSRWRENTLKTKLSAERSQLALWWRRRLRMNGAWLIWRSVALRQLRDTAATLNRRDHIRIVHQYLDVWRMASQCTKADQSRDAHLALDCLLAWRSMRIECRIARVLDVSVSSSIFRTILVIWFDWVVASLEDRQRIVTFQKRLQINGAQRSMRIWKIRQQLRARIHANLRALAITRRRFIGQLFLRTWREFVLYRLHLAGRGATVYAYMVLRNRLAKFKIWRQTAATARIPVLRTGCEARLLEEAGRLAFGNLKRHFQQFQVSVNAFSSQHPFVGERFEELLSMPSERRKEALAAWQAWTACQRRRGLRKDVAARARAKAARGSQRNAIHRWLAKSAETRQARHQSCVACTLYGTVLLKETCDHWSALARSSALGLSAACRLSRARASCVAHVSLRGWLEYCRWESGARTAILCLSTRCMQHRSANLFAAWRNLARTSIALETRRSLQADNFRRKKRRTLASSVVAAWTGAAHRRALAAREALIARSLECWRLYVKEQQLLRKYLHECASANFSRSRDEFCVGFASSSDVAVRPVEFERLYAQMAEARWDTAEEAGDDDDDD